MDWVEDSNPARMADPETAYRDVREVHAFITRELERTAVPIRVYHLTQERKRLAEIAWKLKRRI
jgi:hypothetical protein